MNLEKNIWMEVYSNMAPSSLKKKERKIVFSEN